MFTLGRRHFLAAQAVSMAGLGLRRAAARPVRAPTLVELLKASPVPLPVPVAIEPEDAPCVVDIDGWWIERNGWAYNARMGGWLHSMFPIEYDDNDIAKWYGPPPPLRLP